MFFSNVETVFLLPKYLQKTPLPPLLPTLHRYKRRNINANKSEKKCFALADKIVKAPLEDFF